MVTLLKEMSMNTRFLSRLLAALLLVASPLTHASSVLTGTAYSSFPKQDGSGGYDHYYGFSNLNDALSSLEASLSNDPYNCGTSGAVRVGFTSNVYINVGEITVSVLCKIPNSNTTTNGASGAVWATCPNASYYLGFMSSAGLTACTTPAGPNVAKAVGTTKTTANLETISVTKEAGCLCQKLPGKPTISTSNHINIASGNEWIVEQDYVGTGPYPLQFSRVYNSGSPINTPHGAQWSNYYGRKLLVSTNTSYPIVGVFREDGRSYSYSYAGGIWATDSDITDKLVQLAGGTGWTLTTAENDVEHYDSTGKLLSITNRAGFTHTLDYDATVRVWHVTDRAGRQLTFGYDAYNRVSTLTVPDGGVYQYAYDINNNLTQITYPDAKTRQYLYDEVGYVSTTPANGISYTSALTGIIDENNVRFASYWYDANGRVNKEEHAPGLGLGIDKNTLTYSYDGSGNPLTTVTDSLGTARTFSFQTILGIPRSTGQTQPAGSGSAAASSAQAYDTNANVISSKDFNGNTSCYAYDLTRNLETVRVEGLAPGKACPSNLATYVPVTTAGAVERKITTQWSSTVRLPTLVAEPLRITTFGYDAQGNLLTTTVQPTTDATGGSGTAGTHTGAARTTSYTYYASSDASNGQLETVDGPRTDVSDVTTYGYDATTGDLTSVTNALNQVTTLSGYDANGRPGAVTDPNGLTASLFYDPRGRLTSVDVGGENTSYTYDGVGNLTNVALPSGASFTYTYDDAHRLTEIMDSLGNHVNYTLDAAGNRTKVQVFDSNGTLVTTHSRTFDALSRLYQKIGAVNQTATVQYDANGNVTKMIDPLNRQTTNTFDALNHLISSKDPLNGTATLGYDDRDQMVKVTDPRNLVTQYTRDGLGNQSQLVSPDTGTTGSTFDAAGNVLTRTDAKGNVGTFAYDALNRVQSATYTNGAATPLSITYSYDQGVDGIGHLTGITEPTGTTAYSYDQHGRLSSEVRTAHGMAYTTSYGYDSQGRLASIGYPSGRLVSYTFDSVGRVNQVSTTVNSVTTILASNITYEPFGGVKWFNFGDGVTAPIQAYARTFDTDGRIASYTLNGVLNTVSYDTASQISSITSALYPTLPATYGYDSLSRLTSYIQNTTAYSYGYDADGNRSTQTLGTSTTTYTYPTTSNRLSGIVHGGTTVITEDANGSVTNDFDRQYTYDLRGRLIQTTTTLGNVSYEVDALGLRVRKQAAYSGGADTMFFYDHGGHLLGEVPTGTGTFGREYVYLGDMPLAVTGGTGFSYVHTDHLGTPRLITNTAGQIVWLRDNVDPYGNNVPNENPAGLGIYHFDIGSAGQYRDSETGIVYNINRNLNTTTGRYNESDRIGLGGGINTFSNVKESLIKS